jgi:hypothetical protein
MAEHGGAVVEEPRLISRVCRGCGLPFDAWQGDDYLFHGPKCEALWKKANRGKPPPGGRRHRVGRILASGRRTSGVLTMPQAAALAGVSRKVLWHRCQQGLVAYTGSDTGKRVLIDEAEIRRAIAAGVFGERELPPPAALIDPYTALDPVADIPQDPDAQLTREEAAIVAGVSSHQVYDRIRSGHLKHITMKGRGGGGKNYRIRRGDLDAAIEAGVFSTVTDTQRVGLVAMQAALQAKRAGGDYISHTETTTLLGVSGTTVRNLQQKGTLPKPLTRPAVLAYQEARDSGALAVQAAQAAVERAEAALHTTNPPEPPQKPRQRATGAPEGHISRSRAMQQFGVSERKLSILVQQGLLDIVYRGAFKFHPLDQLEALNAAGTLHNPPSVVYPEPPDPRPTDRISMQDALRQLHVAGADITYQGLLEEANRGALGAVKFKGRYWLSQALVTAWAEAGTWVDALRINGNTGENAATIHEEAADNPETAGATMTERSREAAPEAAAPQEGLGFAPTMTLSEAASTTGIAQWRLMAAARNGTLRTTRANDHKRTYLTTATAIEEARTAGVFAPSDWSAKAADRPGYYTLSQAAEALHIPRHQVMQAIKDGVFAGAVQDAPKAPWYVPVAEVERITLAAGKRAVAEALAEEAMRTDQPADVVDLDIGHIGMLEIVEDPDVAPPIPALRDAAREYMQARASGELVDTSTVPGGVVGESSPLSPGTLEYLIGKAPQPIGELPTTGDEMADLRSRLLGVRGTLAVLYAEVDMALGRLDQLAERVGEGDRDA